MDSAKSISLREALAKYAHEDAWAGWMEYMIAKGTFINERGMSTGSQDRNARLVMPAWAIATWVRKMNLPYEQLSEEEKESDRAQADKILAIVAQYGDAPNAKQPDQTIQFDARQDAVADVRRLMDEFCREIETRLEQMTQATGLSFEMEVARDVIVSSEGCIPVYDVTLRGVV